MRTGDRLVCYIDYYDTIKGRYIFHKNKSYKIVGFEISKPILLSEIGLHTLKEIDYNFHFKPISMNK